jgi:fucose permease
MLPILAGFFVMGFSDIIGTVMNQVKAECGLSDAMAGFLPSMIFIWFFLISVPTGIVCGKCGRRNTVLVSLAVTAAAMFLALAANAERFWIYFVVFALLGIGNTIIQAALPALMSNVVPQDQLTSRISLGQFVKAICAALTPVFVYLTATALGNWKLLFPLYGLITVVCALWLMVSKIPDEREAQAAKDAARPSFLGSLRLLGDGYVLAMVGGIFFSVAADVGYNVAIPDFLKGFYKMDVDKAGMGPTVYFVAKTIGAFLGALIFAKISPAKCFPWSVALAVAGTAGIFFAPTPTVFLVCVFTASLGIANTFGMCMGLAINRRPDKTNEVSSLVVMAIAGGAVVTPALGLVQQSSMGVFGLVWVLLACLAYLFVLGLKSR